MSLATYFVPLAVALTGAFAIESAASPQRPSLRPGDLAIRAAGYALITLFWFQFSWRPWLAASSCLLTLAILSVVDRLKRRVIGEPVVFSDLALLAQVPRHPQLYYTLPLTDLRIAGPLLLAIATVVAWYVLEPAALPSGTGASLLAILGLPAALAALALAGLTPLGQRALRHIFPHPDLARDVARYGLVATMMGYALRRLSEDDARPVPARGEGSPDDEIVVVVQLESFLDPGRLGGPDLPAMARIRAQAAQYGRLAVPAHGAYTMRSEHAVLTGLDPESLGFGRYDPYLARKGEEPTSLARLARAAGFETVFVHPFHRDFFDRARVFQRLGFERLVMEEDFAGAPRIGPYIGDVAVADRILAELAKGRGSTKGRTFMFSVTMENHGPWKPGRLTGIDEPLAQYLHHVTHTGQAIERLIDGLAGRRATLCVFGDHAPSLPDLRPPESGPMATDYALFRFGRDGGPPPAWIDLTAAQLGCVLRDAVTPKR
ncbi:LTA synthase family protein [Methylorubrum extorquens]|uniref:LTA synthase family protein n=1 Tax=Methylorubrum extorquens TaxID=408 RepID=UPI002238EB6D|nr:LTA synthase family protein [Methylorubrum extorquens]UYW31371.1 LTA synthase family protein [Methylorubrum extorquens]